MDWRIGTRAAMEWAKKKGREHRERKVAVRRNTSYGENTPRLSAGLPLIGDSSLSHPNVSCSEDMHE